MAAAKGACVPSSTSTAQASLAKAASKRRVAALVIVPSTRGVLAQENCVPSMPDLARIKRTSGCATEEHNRYGNNAKQVWPEI